MSWRSAALARYVRCMALPGMWDCMQGYVGGPTCSVIAAKCGASVRVTVVDMNDLFN